MGKLVSMVKKNDCTVISINNPPYHVLTSEVLQELLSVINEAEKDNETKVVIFTGADKDTFSPGVNIKEFPNWAEQGRAFAEIKSLELQHTFNRIAELRKPTIAAINGLTLGGGCELVLSCDMRIIEEQAKIGLPEIKLGLFPGAGGSQRLPRLVGEAKAKELMFTGKSVTGTEATKIGLANEVVPQGKALEKALELASQISSFSMPSLQLLKEAVNQGMSTSLREGLKIEAENFGHVFETEDVREGIDAFINKRAPVFNDR